jgi:hypothetical protein
MSTYFAKDVRGQDGDFTTSVKIKIALSLFSLRKIESSSLMSRQKTSVWPLVRVGFMVRLSCVWGCADSLWRFYAFVAEGVAACARAF